MNITAMMLNTGADLGNSLLLEPLSKKMLTHTGC